jgi:hypothetical protein
VREFYRLTYKATVFAQPSSMRADPDHTTRVRCRVGCAVSGPRTNGDGMR